MATPVTTMHRPGQGNVFVPGATEQLHVEFSRNPASFALNRYMQILSTEKLIGFYAELDNEEAIRYVSVNDYQWPDGQPRPRGTTRPLRWKQYSCFRNAYDFSLGDLTVGQADFDIVAAHARTKATLCMTARTNEASTTLTTSGNWPSANTFATLDALGVTSGSWATSSTSQLFIRKSFNAVKKTIIKTTGGAVSPNDLLCVINPNQADTMSQTAEIQAYMTQHEQAMGNLAGDDRRMLDDYGLPPVLYGVTMVVEDSVEVTTRFDVDTIASAGFIFPDSKAVFVSRVGGLEGTGTVNGNAAPSYSTLVGFFQEEMSVEAQRDDWDRMTEGSVVDTRDIILSTGASGVFLQDTTT